MAWIGGLLGVVFLFSALDMIVSGFLTPKNRFSLVSGTSQWINGEMPSPIKELGALHYRVNAPHLRLVFKQIQGRLWRAVLEAMPEAPAGEYTLEVLAQGIAAPGELPKYQVRIYASQAALRQSYPSIIRRTLGWPPLYLLLASLPMVIGALAVSYYLSGRIESQLFQIGIAPIAKMARTKEGWEIHFPLSGLTGIGNEEPLQLLTPDFRPIGPISLAKIQDAYGIAIAPATAAITPAHWIALSRRYSSGSSQAPAITPNR